MQSEFTIGIVRNSHGIRGEVKVYSTSGEMQHFHKLDSVTLAQADGSGGWKTIGVYQVKSVRGKPEAIILALEGIDNPEDAAILKGASIRVPREYAAPLGENEYYIGDLFGCHLYFEDTDIGRVKNVWNNGLQDMLEIQLTEGGTRVVPFSGQFIGTVSLEDARIELKEVWILE